MGMYPLYTCSSYHYLAHKESTVLNVKHTQTQQYSQELSLFFEKITSERHSPSPALPKHRQHDYYHPMRGLY